MSTKSTSKKNGSFTRTSSPQETPDDEVLLTQVHKLPEGPRGNTHLDATRAHDDEVAQVTEKPAGHVLPDEPSDSVQGNRVTASDDSASQTSLETTHFFSAMTSSSVSIALTGAQVTLMNRRAYKTPRPLLLSVMQTTMTVQQPIGLPPWRVGCLSW